MLFRSAAYALTDNRLTEVNPMDAGEVAAILKEIEAATGSVDVPGYSVEDVSGMFKDNHTKDLDPSPAHSDIKYRIIVDCDDEVHQAMLLGCMEKEGWKCQPLIS